MKIIYIIFSIFLTPLVPLFAQNKVTLGVDRFPSYKVENLSIYVAGTFNNWNPKDQNYQLKTINNKIGITIDLPTEMFEYKFTRGSWAQCEASENGEKQPNRKAFVNRDTTIHVEIKNWADHFEMEKKLSTASKNVHILSSNFFIPQLKRHRRIWIYLPASYSHSTKRYPVLYMQDGQNIFDDVTSFSGEWGVDETLDSLAAEVEQSIVVGIDNGGEKRINEYSPYDMQAYGRGEGKLYTAFLVKTLKPYIDKNFRTKKDKANTFIAGSSMGGLISFYGLLNYPKIFGGAGIFSPALWMAPQLLQDVEKNASKVTGKIYFYAGKQEGEQMVPDMLNLLEKMHQISKAKMHTVIREEGIHSEANWRKEFPDFYQWIQKK
ncbi:MAG: alpha/beta hydrolase-fold protein [Flavisolibacter sp.]